MATGKDEAYGERERLVTHSDATQSVKQHIPCPSCKVGDHMDCETHVKVEVHNFKTYKDEIFWACVCDLVKVAKW